MTFDESTEFCEKNVQSQSKAVADLHSKILDVPSPRAVAKFFQFHAVFGKIRQNCMLPPYQHRRRPHFWEILDPPLKSILSADQLSGNLMSYQSTTNIERIFKILPRFMLQ